MGLLSETFVNRRIIQNDAMGITNKIITGKIYNGLNNSYIESITELCNSRYFNKVNAIKYKVFDTFFGGYHSFSVDTLIRNILDFQPDIIHVHFGYPVFSLERAIDKCIKENKAIRMPSIIVSLHGSDVLSFPNRFSQQGNSCLALVELTNVTFVVPTEFLKKKAIINYGLPLDKIVVIPNMVDESVFPELLDAKVLVPKYNQIECANIARFVNWKGHKYLIEGFALFLNKTGCNAKLNLIGDGPLLKDMKHLSTKLGIGNQVVFHGAISHKDVEKTLSKSDIYLHASIRDEKTNQEESFGIAILESIYAGLACITTITGGIPDVIGNFDKESVQIQTVEQQSAEALCSALMLIYIKGYKTDLDYVKQRKLLFSSEAIDKAWNQEFVNLAG
jgi:glycosyltransferase involved in cell wall biosynthesis